MDTIANRNTYLWSAVCTLLLSFAVGCGSYSSPKTHREADDPTADTLADWSHVSEGLHAAWGTTDRRYPRSVAPESLAEECNVTAWRGERVAAQILLWSADSVDGVQCRVGTFKGEDGKSLPAEIAEARFVRYVVTDVFGPGCGYRKDGDFPISLSADMLDTLDRFDMDARTVRPVWLTIHVPANAAPGLYHTQVDIVGRGAKTQTLDLALRVQNKTLPTASEWSYQLDLWQHPASVARLYGLELWSDAHFAALKPMMELLAEAGQKVVTATLNKDPWNHQCYDAYEDMILWTKHADGTWSYDYTAFDRWVEMMFSIGINDRINCYSMLPWNNELHYRDEATGQTVTLSANPSTPLFAELWTPFLKDFTTHLAGKGWLDKTCIAMDERSPETMDEALGLLSRETPKLGIALADNHASYKRYPNLKDVCVQIDCRVADEDLAQRRRDSLITTYYVCCSSAFPNTFTFSQPWESVYMAWFAAAAGYDGMLRWSYNSWQADPVRDSRFTAWPAGDTYIVYPDARSSIRFERLIEGIQDYEKIRILRAELAAAGTPEAAAKLAELNSVVSVFTSTDATQPWVERLSAAKQTLAKLSE